MARDVNQIVSDAIKVIDNTNMVDDKEFILHFVRRELLELKRLLEQDQGKIRTR